MAISITSITPVTQNANGKVKEVVATVVVTGTYSAGGTVLTAAQKQALGADGKIIWIDNGPSNILQLQYNATTGALQAFVNGTGVEAGAISGAGTYSVKVQAIATGASAPSM